MLEVSPVDPLAFWVGSAGRELVSVEPDPLAEDEGERHRELEPCGIEPQSANSLMVNSVPREPHAAHDLCAVSESLAPVPVQRLAIGRPRLPDVVFENDTPMMCSGRQWVHQARGANVVAGGAGTCERRATRRECR